MQQLKKMGSMKKMLGMIPGMGGQMKQQLENFDEREIDRTEAIIRAMTPAERHNTKILNGSRRARIARGSGVTVTDINQLVNRFEQAAKMMKKVARGENAGHSRHGRDARHEKPGACSEAPARRTRASSRATRLGQPRASARRRTPALPAPQAPAGSGFGLGAPRSPATRASLDMAEIQKLFGNK